MTFKKFIITIKLDIKLSDELKDLYESITVNYTVFVKFEEIWAE